MDLTERPGPDVAGLYAVSDLYVGNRDNREVLKRIRPTHPDDWLIVAGDVAERLADVDWTLMLLRDRFAGVLWVPGNHELWTNSDDGDDLRGVRRYERLVDLCRGLEVATPEDPYPLWHGADGTVRIAPLFLLYDYTFLTPGTTRRRSRCAPRTRAPRWPRASALDWSAVRWASGGPCRRSCCWQP